VAWFSVGNAQFATHPGETSPAFSLQTKTLMKTGPKFILGLGLDQLGYIIEQEKFGTLAQLGFYVVPHLVCPTSDVVHKFYNSTAEGRDQLVGRVAVVGEELHEPRVEADRVSQHHAQHLPHILQIPEDLPLPRHLHNLRRHHQRVTAARQVGVALLPNPVQHLRGRGREGWWLRGRPAPCQASAVLPPAFSPSRDSPRPPVRASASWL
jgi:hypothetical protein